MPSQRVGLHHPRVRQVLSLARNGAADDHLFVAEGVWAHEMLARAGTFVETFLWCPDVCRGDRARACVERVSAMAEKAYEISPKVLARLTARARPDGLISVARLPRWDPAEVSVDESSLVLVVDGIEYAGNLGTLIRTADACHADCLLVTSRQVRLTHPRVFVASRGTVLTTPIVEFLGSAQAAEWLESRGFEIFLADPEATLTYRACGFRRAPTAVVVGSEGQGLPPAWYDRKVTAVSIPMLGTADSLNVSVSAAILLYEARAAKAGW